MIPSAVEFQRIWPLKLHLYASDVYICIHLVLNSAKFSYGANSVLYYVKIKTTKSWMFQFCEAKTMSEPWPAQHVATNLSLCRVYTSVLPSIQAAYPEICQHQLLLWSK